MFNKSTKKYLVLKNIFTLKGCLIDEIIIHEEKIKHINEKTQINNNENKIELYFNDAIILPGLINSHDHLDFNLFPKLGNKIYEDYLAWGKDIHIKNNDVIKSVLKIPKALRIKWGIYKNLLAGITTVVHHGERIKIQDDLINVYQRCNVLHSVQLEKFFKIKLNNPFAKKFPFVLHVGEGTNKKSQTEISKLIKWNLFKKEIIGVHGIAMTEEQARFFKALIWCVDSNLFLQHKTAAINHLKKHTTILFGTDSTVSADWNIWHQLRVARKTGLLNDAELYNTVTENANFIWNLNAGCIAEEKFADIIVVKRKNTGDKFDIFFSLNPEDILLIICKGEIILFDESLLIQLKYDLLKTSFSKIFINNNCKYVKGNLPALVDDIKKFAPTVNVPISY